MADPSATFVGELGSPEDDARLAMLERMMREQSPEVRISHKRIRPKLDWNSDTGEWVSNLPAPAPDPTSFERLNPRSTPTASFDFPHALSDSLPEAEAQFEAQPSATLWARLRSWLG